jgi:peptidyl-dipeptidase A
MTGEKQIDATAMLDYFKPLMAWLEKENKGRKLGWQ